MWPAAARTATAVTIREATVPAGLEPIARREHCRISHVVADDLDLTFDAAVSNWGQVRAFHRPAAGQAIDRSAAFTVAEIFDAGTTRAIEVYPSDGTALGGMERLTGEAGLPAMPGVAELCSAAPSSSTYRSGTTQETRAHFAEPVAGAFFVESAVRAGHNRLILLVPHGGGIERFCSEQAAAFVAAFTAATGGCGYASGVNLWDCQGQYPDPESPLPQWHVTAPDLHLGAFPALARLVAETPPFKPGVPFQYVVALHGITGASVQRIVVGGRASTTAKVAVRDDLAEVSPDFEFCLFLTPAAGSDAAVAHAGNAAFCTQLAPFRGVAAANVVNRLSPNPTGVRHRGGIQLEQTLQARTAHAAALGRALAGTICRLLGQTPLVDVYEPPAAPVAGSRRFWRDLGVTRTRLAKPDLEDRSRPLPAERVVRGGRAYGTLRFAHRAGSPAPRTAAYLFHTPPALLVDPSRWRPAGVADLGEVGLEQVGEASFEWDAPESGRLTLIAVLHDEELAPEELLEHARGWNLRQVAGLVQESGWLGVRNLHRLSLEEEAAGGVLTGPLSIAGFHAGEHAFRLLAETRLPGAGTLTLEIPEALFALLEAGRDPAVGVDAGKGTVRLKVPAAGEYALGEGVLAAGAAWEAKVEIALPDGLDGSAAGACVRLFHEELEVGCCAWEVGP